jgi:hypothetical protein
MVSNRCSVAFILLNSLFCASIVGQTADHLESILENQIRYELFWEMRPISRAVSNADSKSSDLMADVYIQAQCLCICLEALRYCSTYQTGTSGHLWQLFATVLPDKREEEGGLLYDIYRKRHGPQTHCFNLSNAKRLRVRLTVPKSVALEEIRVLQLDPGIDRLIDTVSTACGEWAKNTGKKELIVIPRVSSYASEVLILHRSGDQWIEIMKRPRTAESSWSSIGRYNLQFDPKPQIVDKILSLEFVRIQCSPGGTVRAERKSN